MEAHTSCSWNPADCGLLMFRLCSDTCLFYQLWQQTGKITRSLSCSASVGKMIFGKRFWAVCAAVIYCNIASLLKERVMWCTEWPYELCKWIYNHSELAIALSMSISLAVPFMASIVKNFTRCHCCLLLNIEFKFIYTLWNNCWDEHKADILVGRHTETFANKNVFPKNGSLEVTPLLSDH